MKKYKYILKFYIIPIIMLKSPYSSEGLRLRGEKLIIDNVCSECEYQNMCNGDIQNMDYCPAKDLRKLLQ